MVNPDSIRSIDDASGNLSLEQPAVPQRPLQRRLHLHVAQLCDGEVEVLDGGVVLVRVVLQQQLGQGQCRQCALWPVAKFLNRSF